MIKKYVKERRKYRKKFSTYSTKKDISKQIEYARKYEDSIIFHNEEIDELLDKAQ
jgi:hypothetical protein